MTDTVDESNLPRRIYQLGLWIWWHRLVACFVGIFTAFTLALTVQIWQLTLSDPSAAHLMLMLTTVLMSATLILVAAMTLQRGRERVSWISLEPGDRLLIRTLNGTLRRIPASDVGKRQFRHASTADEHTGFTFDDPRLVLPVQGGVSLYIDLMDGQILDEPSFSRLFRWSRERPTVGGGRRPGSRHKKKRAA
jgi:hypothetical protein